MNDCHSLLNVYLLKEELIWLVFYFNFRLVLNLIKFWFIYLKYNTINWLSKDMFKNINIKYNNLLNYNIFNSLVYWLILLTYIYSWTPTEGGSVVSISDSQRYNQAIQNITNVKCLFITKTNWQDYFQR